MRSGLLGAKATPTIPQVPFGNPFLEETFVHVSPPSVDLYKPGVWSSNLYLVVAMYTVALSCGETSMAFIKHSANPAGVIFFQLAPPSFVKYK